jgi:hypothetical protein
MFKIKKIYTKQEYVKKVLKDFPDYFKQDFLHVGHCFTDTKDQYTHVIIDEEDIMYKVGKKFLKENKILDGKKKDD